MPRARGARQGIIVVSISIQSLGLQGFPSLLLEASPGLKAESPTLLPSDLSATGYFKVPCSPRTCRPIENAMEALGHSDIAVPLVLFHLNPPRGSLAQKRLTDST